MTKQQEAKKRQYKIQILNGILGIILSLVILQLWLLMASMNALLGGDYSILWPSFFASLVCFAMAVGLLFYIRD